MLKIEVIKFEAQDIITTSTPDAPKPFEPANPEVNNNPT